MKYRVLSLPSRGGPNPYVSLYYDALLPYDVELVGRLKFDIRWFKKNIDKFDAIHLHWPEALWRNYKGELVKEIRNLKIPGSWKMSNFVHWVIGEIPVTNKINWFENCLKFLQLNGKHIIWTWHNEEPHERFCDIDYWGCKALVEYADLIIFHSEITEKSCRKKYNISAHTIIMAHGNYDGIYPNPRDNVTVLSELGLNPDKPVVACLGGIRDYKGLEVACEAIKKLEGAVQFICAGAPNAEFDLDNLENMISEIDHTVLIPRMITDQEFVDFVDACDFLLLPYKKVSGSGALLAYLTLGRGVIASDLPFFREVLSGVPNAGVLFEPNESSALASAIKVYLQVSPGLRNEDARLLADKYNWDEIVVPVAEYYHEVLMKN